MNADTPTPNLYPSPAGSKREIRPFGESFCFDVTSTHMTRPSMYKPTSLQLLASCYRSYSVPRRRSSHLRCTVYHSVPMDFLAIGVG